VSAPELIRAGDAQDAAQRAAELLAAALREGTSQRGAAHLALSGGETPRRCYELLGASDVDWRHVHVWLCDERCVPAGDERSNMRLVRETLGDVPASFHPVDGTLAPDDAARAYERELGDVVLDAALLGIGPDGHTASLFPGGEELRAPGRVAGVTDAPKPPPERVSLTLATLAGARSLVLLVTGSEKGPALAAALGAPSPSTPASMLARERLTVVASADALA
jgi:6-phosphogluconolactonase